jgi:hypothetical protein
VPLDRRRRDFEQRRGFLHRQAGEIAQFHHPRLVRGDGGERAQGLIQPLDIEAQIQPRLHRIAGFIDRHVADVGPAAFQGAAMAGVIDQDASHGFGGGAIEVPPVLELQLAQAGQPQVGFVDQRRGLQRVFRALAPQDAIGNPAKLRVHALDQRLEGGGVSGVPPIEQLRDVFHTWRRNPHFKLNELFVGSSPPCRV